MQGYRLVGTGKRDEDWGRRSVRVTLVAVAGVSSLSSGTGRLFRGTFQVGLGTRQFKPGCVGAGHFWCSP
ncbi:MAG: hypothetical protein FJ134_02640 [Deltaproteobacteria bacterium]|nr:hypothetical protein [Deltaproteobacteria bacterium]